MQKELQGAQQLPSLTPFSKALTYSGGRTNISPFLTWRSRITASHTTSAPASHPLVFSGNRYHQQCFHFPKIAGCSFCRGASNHLNAAQTRHGVLRGSRALLDVHSSLFPQRRAVSNTFKLNSCSLQLFPSKIQRSFFLFPL